MRRKTVRLKLNTIKSEFHGKNVLLIDDSIVRGTTSMELVQMARDAGAKKVRPVLHLLSSYLILSYLIFVFSRFHLLFLINFIFVSITHFFFALFHSPHSSFSRVLPLLPLQLNSFRFSLQVRHPLYVTATCTVSTYPHALNS